MEAGEIRAQWAGFSPHPDLDESYFEPKTPDLLRRSVLAVAAAQP